MRTPMIEADRTGIRRSRGSAKNSAKASDSRFHIGAGKGDLVEVLVRAAFLLGPGSSPIGRLQNDTDLAHGRSVIRIGESDGEESIGCSAGLRGPGRSAIGGAQDGAQLTHDGAGLR